MEKVYFILGIVTILSIISFIVSVVVIFMVVNKYLKLKEKVKDSDFKLDKNINEFDQSVSNAINTLRNNCDDLGDSLSKRSNKRLLRYI